MSHPAELASKPLPAARTQFGIFAKHWRPGQVKTRLARDLGDAAAANLYRHFLKTLLVRLAATGERCVLAVTPPEQIAEFKALPIAGWELQPQAVGDLGARLQHYFAAAFAAGMERVVLIGSDSPDLPREYVAEAFEQLRSQAVVLGPSHDGGYYLVGAAGRMPPIFNGIAWSTSRVWPQTLERLRNLGIAHAELPPWYDVDEMADLRRLAASLQAAANLEEPLRELATLLRSLTIPCTTV